MPVPENIRLSTIINNIKSSISSYNQQYSTYNRAYNTFVASRFAGISTEGNINDWLRKTSTSNRIRNLMITFGMDSRKSSLVDQDKFSNHLNSIPEIININGLENFSLSNGSLTRKIDNSTVAIELGKLFDYCAKPGNFSVSGGFVIGSKVSHCIIPQLCPMVDITHIGISLYNIHQDDYLPPGNNWKAYIVKTPFGKPNPSPRGAGRNSWKTDQILCAIGLYARLHEEWQDKNGNPGVNAFLELDSPNIMSGIPRILDKVLW